MFPFIFLHTHTNHIDRDTVGSVGFIPKRLPFTTFNTHVKAFRQALALDEHRVRFKPNFFNRPTHEEMSLGLKWGEKHGNTKSAKKIDRRHTLRQHERSYTRHLHCTDVEEVWFSGCHCGAYSNNFFSFFTFVYFDSIAYDRALLLLCRRRRRRSAKRSAQQPRPNLPPVDDPRMLQT